MMKKHAALLLTIFCVCVLAACSSENEGIPLNIPDAAEIELRSEMAGKSVKITDKEDVEYITDNFNAQRYIKDRKNDSDGYSYSLKWYDNDGKLLFDTMVMNPNRISFGNNFYNKAQINTEIDTAFLDEMLKNGE